MITNLIQMVGSYAINESNDPRIKLLSFQKPFTGKYPIIVSVDHVSDKIIGNTKEYLVDKEPLYLRGMVGSGGSSLSRTMNLSLDKIKDYKNNKDPDFVSIYSNDNTDKSLWDVYLKMCGNQKLANLLEPLKAKILTGHGFRLTIGDEFQEVVLA